jgi:hypothetical protein
MIIMVTDATPSRRSRWCVMLGVPLSARYELVSMLMGSPVIVG